MADEQSRKAYFYWYYRFNLEKKYDRANAESSFLFDKKVVLPCRGNLKRARQASLISTIEMAARLGVSNPAYVKMEKREEEGLIKISSLEKAAEALNCDLIYVLRPKEQRTFSERIWDVIYPISLQKYKGPRSATEIAKAMTLAAAARRILEDPKFRRQQKWSER